MQKLTEVSQKHDSMKPKRKYRFKNGTPSNNNRHSFSEGQWSSEQNLALAVFMDVHHFIFCSIQRRKATKIFTYLSDYLKTRNAQQCRSHFQKVIEKFESINRFKAYCKRQSGIEAFKQKLVGCPNFHNILSQKLIKEEEKKVIKIETNQIQPPQPMKKEVGIQTNQQEQKIEKLNFECQDFQHIKKSQDYYMNFQVMYYIPQLFYSQI